MSDQPTDATTQLIQKTMAIVTAPRPEVRGAVTLWVSTG